MVKEGTCVLEDRVDVIALVTIVLESTDEGNEGVGPTAKNNDQFVNNFCIQNIVFAYSNTYSTFLECNSL